MLQAEAALNTLEMKVDRERDTCDLAGVFNCFYPMLKYYVRNLFILFE